MFTVCGAWSQHKAQNDARTPALLLWLEEGARAANFNTNQWADALGVTPAYISNMRECRDSGPGILRFAQMPPAFWVGFLKAAAKHFCYRLIDEPWVDRICARIDFLQVSLMDRQLELKMAKADLPEPIQERKRA